MFKLIHANTNQADAMRTLRAGVCMSVNQYMLAKVFELTFF